MRLGDQQIEFVDMNNQLSDHLKKLDGMELLTPESKNNLLRWCSKIQVTKRIDHYHPLIIDYQNEIAYRKARDVEYQFRDILDRSMFRQTKIENRRNKAVLPISVSDTQAKPAFKIIDALIKSVNELNEQVFVESGEQDNASFRLFEHAFSF